MKLPRTAFQSLTLLLVLLLGSAAPDRHGAMVREIRETAGKSYDLKDHEEVLAAGEHAVPKLATLIQRIIPEI